ncbi:hypothetical protein L1987_17469 [Smallanthus sonchifolius]|uniref:Uncharacterized protein n=1 Tax=Smallanthus sonchifolius TaxID=185202 RepID=A0ACB9J0H2_9ASTR|nr:hypothetical protein L1987_17469 [Smallanthus sonchifolius]
MSECRSDQAVGFASHSFAFETLSWWENVKKAKSERDIDRMKGDDMKALVIQKFCPQNEIDKMEEAFVELKAGSMTHRQFTSKFNELTQLVPHMVNSKERRIKCYIQKLLPRVRTIINANASRDFDSVVAMSGKIFDDKAAEGTTPTETQKKWSSTTKHSGGDWSASKSKNPRVEEKTICNKCGKAHLGECKYGLNMCYRCGKTGHISRECTNALSSVNYGKCHNCGESGHFSKDYRKPRTSNNEKAKEAGKGGARTRAYALTQEEARGDPNVVSGTFILNHTFVSVLFDSGASKSFISFSFCKRLKYKMFNVETAVGRNTKVVELVDDLTIKIEGQRFPVKLFVIELGGFDVVLGMDWLATNEARMCVNER